MAEYSENAVLVEEFHRVRMTISALDRSFSWSVHHPHVGCFASGVSLTLLGAHKEASVSKVLAHVLGAHGLLKIND